MKMRDDNTAGMRQACETVIATYQGLLDEGLDTDKARDVTVNVMVAMFASMMPKN